MARIRRTFAAALATVVVAGGLLLATPSAEAQTAPEPIIFVHGWNSNTGVWNTMRDRFVASGFPSNRLFSFGYNTSQSNKTTAAQFATYVDQVRAQTGSPTVDIVSHSMGSLSTRWCIKFGGCNGEVDDWVSLAGVNHGTAIALCFWQTSCREMFPSSGFLSDLNSGDETPGAVSWATLRGSLEAVVVPASSVSLSGATNVVISGLGHNNLTGNATVYNQVRAWVVD